MTALTGGDWHVRPARPGPRRQAIEDRAARALGEVFPGERSIEVPVITLCWRTDRLAR